MIQDGAEMDNAPNISTTEKTPTLHDVSADHGDFDIAVFIDHATDDTTFSPSTCFVFRCNICEHFLSGSRGLSMHR